MSAKRWVATALVMGFSLAFAGQALAGTELEQRFKAARQNGENLVEVVRLALQSGADLTEVAAAADGAGIAADIVTAAALAAGQQPPRVARAVELGSDSNLGYLEPTASRPLSDSEVTSGTTVVAETSFDRSLASVQKVSGNGGPGDCPSDKTCTPASGPVCCEQASSDLVKCAPHDRCH